MGHDIKVIGTDQEGRDIVQEELPVTYNYTDIYRKAVGESLKEAINGKKCGDTIKILSEMVAKLGIGHTDDRWDATKGNAGYSANILLGWAIHYPNAHWSVT